MRWYVDQNAAFQGDGSQKSPFKHIGDAAAAAKAGDEVLVAPGIYREYVDPVHAGTEDARITLGMVRAHTLLDVGQLGPTGGPGQVTPRHVPIEV